MELSVSIVVPSYNRCAGRPRPESSLLNLGSTAAER